MKTKIMIAAIIGILVGPSVWGATYAVPVLSFIFCILTLVSIFFLIGCGLVQEGGEVWGVINSIVLCCSMFALFCYFGIVPLMPQTEVARTIYGWIGFPLLVAGGGSTGAEIIIIIL